MVFCVILQLSINARHLFQTVLLMMCVLTAGSMPKKAGWNYPEDEGQPQSHGSFTVPTQL